MFDLIGHIGVTYNTAYNIATAVSAGMSLATVVGLASGVGSLLSMFWLAIKYVAKTKSKAALIGW